MRADMTDACTREGAERVEETRLQFWIASEAWHASREVMGGGRGQVVEEVWFGRYSDGAQWEAAFRWHDLSGAYERRICPRVEMFEDSWAAFGECPALFADLAALHGKSPQPPDIVALLLRHGFEDKTERHDACGRPVHERIRAHGLELYDALREIAPGHEAVKRCEKAARP